MNDFVRSDQYALNGVKPYARSNRPTFWASWGALVVFAGSGFAYANDPLPGWLAWFIFTGFIWLSLQVETVAANLRWQLMVLDHRARLIEGGTEYVVNTTSTRAP